MYYKIHSFHASHHLSPDQAHWITSSYTGGEVSVCDNLSDGSLTDSLSLQLVELYRPALRNGMLMVTLLYQYSNRKEIETVDSSALQMHNWGEPERAPH